MSGALIGGKEQDICFSQPEKKKHIVRTGGCRSSLSLFPFWALHVT